MWIPAWTKDATEDKEDQDILLKLVGSGFVVVWD